MNSCKILFFCRSYKLLILSLFLFKFISCHDDIDALLKTIYKKMKDLPYENKLYYRKNHGSCLHVLNDEIINSLNNYYLDNKTKYICLIKNRFYILINESSYENIFNLSNYLDNEGNQYELNIFKNKNNDLDCIISFTNETKELIHYHYEINLTSFESNHSLVRYFYKNYTEGFAFRKALNCQIMDDIFVLICFYTSSSIFHSTSFNITNNFTEIQSKLIVFDCWNVCEEKIHRTFIKDSKEFFLKFSSPN